MIKRKVFLMVFMIILVFAAYNPDSYNRPNRFKENSILNSYAIEKLKNDIYYFPAKKFSSSSVEYQPLEQFDFIFVGHDINISSKHFDKFQNSAAIIPGRYTHVFVYIGKDVNGFAYAVEMNIDKNQTYSIDFDGLNIPGELQLFCLGKDFVDNSCPIDTYSYGIKSYDYMWAKQLKPKLKNKLLMHKHQLIAAMKEDLIHKLPFQFPLDIDLGTSIRKIAPLIEDGHQNGADCVSYFVSLYEEVAKVCFDEIRIDASTLNSYFLNDPMGRQALFPATHNPLSDEDIYIRDLELSFVNNKPRQTLCPDARVVTGVPTPDLLFNSPSMVEIKSLKK